MSDMHVQRAAAIEARRCRATYLHEVFLGLLSPLDLLVEALDAEHRALRAVRLSEAFGPLDPEAPDYARKAYVPWPTIRRRLLETLALDPRTPDRKLTASWLHDPRAGGLRWLALCDALRRRDEPPWPGFPWEPAPPPKGGVAPPRGG